MVKPQKRKVPSRKPLFLEWHGDIELVMDEPVKENLCSEPLATVVDDVLARDNVFQIEVATANKHAFKIEVATIDEPVFTTDELKINTKHATIDEHDRKTDFTHVGGNSYDDGE